MRRSRGFKRIFVPEVDASEAALVPGIEVVAVPNLGDVVAALNGLAPLRVVVPGMKTGGESSTTSRSTSTLSSLPPITDFQEIKGQETAKRALEVAAAGGHNLLMTGSPGAGKTMLARALPGILPSLTLEEALDVTRIYSVADLLPPETPLIQHRPFRAPHHTVSHAGMIGGGKIPRPGEVSLSHRGVLFLDELPEFDGRTLEVLAPAVGGQMGHHLAGQRHPDLPGRVHADCGAKPVQMRLVWRFDQAVHVLVGAGGRCIRRRSAGRCWTGSTCTWRWRG